MATRVSVMYMKTGHTHLTEIQQLVADLVKIERNHSHLQSDRHENVAEHSYTVAMFCWRLFEIVKPPLDLSKILKYALVHDLLERGLKKDINTFATKEERETKMEQEENELKKLSIEFADFDDLISTVKNYEQRKDPESLFVWTADKMQAKILGEMDGWRPYASYGVTWKQYCDKSEEFLEKCSPYLRDIFTEVYEHTKTTYYDRPNSQNIKM